MNRPVSAPFGWIAALLAVLALAGCSELSNSFEVQVDNGVATAAELRLCGAKAPLSRAGNRFIGAGSSACEGSGEILVSFSDRPAVSCRIGYVTPGAAQSFRFVVKDGRCEPV